MVETPRKNNKKKVTETHRETKKMTGLNDVMDVEEKEEQTRTTATSTQQTTSSQPNGREQGQAPSNDHETEESHNNTEEENIEEEEEENILNDEMLAKYRIEEELEIAEFRINIIPGTTFGEINHYYRTWPSYSTDLSSIENMIAKIGFINHNEMMDAKKEQPYFMTIYQSTATYQDTESYTHWMVQCPVFSNGKQTMEPDLIRETLLRSKVEFQSVFKAKKDNVIGISFETKQRWERVFWNKMAAEMRDPEFQLKINEGRPKKVEVILKVLLYIAKTTNIDYTKCRINFRGHQFPDYIVNFMLGKQNFYAFGGIPKDKVTGKKNNNKNIGKPYNNGWFYIRKMESPQTPTGPFNLRIKERKLRATLLEETLKEKRMLQTNDQKVVERKRSDKQRQGENLPTVQEDGEIHFKTKRIRGNGTTQSSSNNSTPRRNGGTRMSGNGLQSPTVNGEGTPPNGATMIDQSGKSVAKKPVQGTPNRGISSPILRPLYD